jgi:hypothetical protein
MIITILCKHSGIPYCVYTLNVPSCSQQWPEDVFVETGTGSQN